MYPSCLSRATFETWMWMHMPTLSSQVCRRSRKSRCLLGGLKLDAYVKQTAGGRNPMIAIP